MTDEQTETRGEILRQLDDLAEIGGLHLPFAHELRARLARVDDVQKGWHLNHAGGQLKNRPHREAANITYSEVKRPKNIIPAIRYQDRVHPQQFSYATGDSDHAPQNSR